MLVTGQVQTVNKKVLFYPFNAFNTEIVKRIKTDCATTYCETKC